jgi:hypothetical protein
MGGGGLGVGIEAWLGNVLFWIVIGAVAGLAIAAPRTTRQPVITRRRIATW